MTTKQRNSQYIRSRVMLALDAMFARKQEQNLADDTAFSVLQTDLLPVGEMMFRDASLIERCLQSPHFVNLYGEYTITPARNQKDERVVIFVRVPDIDDVVQVEVLNDGTN